MDTSESIAHSASVGGKSPTTRTGETSNVTENRTMTKDQIINHPDVFHFLTVAHAGAASIVEELNSFNPEGNLIVIDDAHPKYSKIYILDSDYAV